MKPNDSSSLFCNAPLANKLHLSSSTLKSECVLVVAIQNQSLFRLSIPLCTMLSHKMSYELKTNRNRVMNLKQKS